uniref:NADH-ubiquinone oxidoreductase chain 4 n=1 Tax=Mactra antiquata TaxID=2302425 RepID=W5QTL0_9BIVA|nr:NADH dehydrogenase subunit 4 [Mactra antiquata]AGH15618.1 NADH dehydrogenase subunit 4 [Mactra antiquata]
MRFLSVWFFITPFLLLSCYSVYFSSMGFFWGLCCSFVLFILLVMSSGMSFFFLIPNSWVMMDDLSFLMEVLVLLVFVLSVACSVKDLSFPLKETSKGLDSGLALISLPCVLFFCVGGWMPFYFFFEFSLIPTLWMILKWGYQPERLQAGMFLLMYTAGASLPLLMCLVFVLLVVGSDSFILMELSDTGYWFSRWLLVPVLLAFFVKLPIYGFHVWLPKAHVEAPLAGSMVLAGVLLKLGGFGLIRVLGLLKVILSEEALLLCSLIIWGGLLSSLISATQHDIKSIIAYSSVSHMSLVAVSILSCYPLAKLAGVCMMFAHGVCSPCMFALAASSYDWSQSRSISMNKSILRLFPWFSFYWFSFIVANMSCPPSLNFFSEVVMFSSIKSIGFVFILPLGLLCEFTCVYCIFLYGFLNHGGVSSFLKSYPGISDRYLMSFLTSFLILFFGFFGLDFFMV